MEIIKSKETRYSENLQKGIEYFNLGPDGYNQALKFFKNAVKINPNLPAVYPFLGKIYYERGMYRESIIHWGNAIKLNPDSLNYRIDLSKVYIRLGLTDEALRELQYVRKNSPPKKGVR